MTGTIISGSYTTGITLSSTASNPVSVTGTIAVASGSALYGIGGASNSWTIDNSGSITAAGGTSLGIKLGTSATNVSSAVIVNGDGGLISAFLVGVFVYGTSSVTNNLGGTIQATEAALDIQGTGTVVNFGVVTGSGGVFLKEGTVTNAGTIDSDGALRWSSVTRRDPAG